MELPGGHCPYLSRPADLAKVRFTKAARAELIDAQD
jgi:hypothetical protein